MRAFKIFFLAALKFTMHYCWLKLFYLCFTVQNFSHMTVIFYLLNNLSLYSSSNPPLITSVLVTISMRSMFFKIPHDWKHVFLCLGNFTAHCIFWIHPFYCKFRVFHPLSQQNNHAIVCMPQSRIHSLMDISVDGICTCWLKRAALWWTCKRKRGKDRPPGQWPRENSELHHRATATVDSIGTGDGHTRRRKKGTSSVVILDPASQEDSAIPGKGKQESPSHGHHHFRLARLSTRESPHPQRL